MSEKPECVKLIEAMPREDFHHKVLKGPAALPEFSTLVCAGVDELSVEEKQVVRNALAAAGIPSELVASDDELDDIATAIAGRSVTLK